ncbi:hypothetical protein KM043_009389 [Ampulex compressa]|nr:hypothetical protein KM043_009389 [Ampulex compressa]
MIKIPSYPIVNCIRFILNLFQHHRPVHLGQNKLLVHQDHRFDQVNLEEAKSPFEDLPKEKKNRALQARGIEETCALAIVRFCKSIVDAGYAPMLGQIDSRHGQRQMKRNDKR